LNDSCASDEFSFRDRAPTSPSREEVKAQAFDRLQEELKKAQEVRGFASIFVIFSITITESPLHIFVNDDVYICMLNGLLKGFSYVNFYQLELSCSI